MFFNVIGIPSSINTSRSSSISMKGDFGWVSVEIKLFSLLLLLLFVFMLLLLISGFKLSFSDFGTTEPFILSFMSVSFSSSFDELGFCCPPFSSFAAFFPAPHEKYPFSILIFYF